MTPSGPRFDAWVDLPRLDAQGLAALLGSPAPRDRLARLTAVSARLPRGLIHAEAVHIVAEPPPDRSPLAPGSAWYAAGPDLVVVLDGGRPDALHGLLSDLAEYAGLTREVAAAGCEDPSLAEAAGDVGTGPAQLRLQAALCTSPKRWAELDETAPGLRADLRGMLARPFDAVIRLHPHVRPGWLAAAGRTWAESIRGACPVDRPWLVFTEGPEAVELMSPYVRDLAAALGQWACENPDRITLPGLRDAWAATRSDDVAALVVPDLFRAAPGLLEERRANERSQGLFIEDRFGTQAGFAELARLAAPDRRAVPAGARGVALVAAGGPTALVTAAAEAWLEGPVAGVAAVFRAGVGGPSVVVPDVVADASDAFVLPGSDDLRAAAASVNVEVTEVDTLELRGRREHSAVRLLGQVRRGQLLGWQADDMPVLVAFGPDRATAYCPTIDYLSAGFEGARLVLHLACSESKDRPPRAAKRPGALPNSHMPRRFRA